MEQFPQWVAELMSTYVLPYWPWIVAAIIGIFVVRYALRRVINRVVGLFVGAILLGGGATTGVSTWLSDRGTDLPNFGFW